MCGRSRCTLNPQAIVEKTGAKEFDDKGKRYKASNNVKPTAWQPVIVQTGKDASTRAIRVMRWGLIPSYSESKESSSHASTFNARDDTLVSSSMWKRCLHRRCAVVAEGFYEWKTMRDGRKQPFYFRNPQGKLLTFAGLWDLWKSEDGSEQILSYTIVTTDAGKELGEIHDRMPVVLADEEALSQWLDCSDAETGKEVAEKVFGKRLAPLLKPPTSQCVEWYMVSDAVNGTVDSVECITPLEEVRKKNLDRFFKKPDPAPSAAAAPAPIEYEESKKRKIEETVTKGGDETPTKKQHKEDS